MSVDFSVDGIALSPIGDMRLRDGPGPRRRRCLCQANLLLTSPQHMHETEPSKTENAAARRSGQELRNHGVEKTDETGRLCRMNLAVHGLEGDIRHGGQVNS